PGVVAESEPGAGQILQFGVRQPGYLPDSMPSFDRGPQKQESPDFGVAVQPSACGPVRCHGAVAALPGAQRIHWNTSQLGNRSDGIEVRHVLCLLLSVSQNRYQVSSVCTGQMLDNCLTKAVCSIREQSVSIVSRLRPRARLSVPAVAPGGSCHILRRGHAAPADLAGGYLFIAHVRGYGGIPPLFQPPQLPVGAGGAVPDGVSGPDFGTERRALVGGAASGSSSLRGPRAGHPLAPAAWILVGACRVGAIDAA